MVSERVACLTLKRGGNKHLSKVDLISVTNAALLGRPKECGCFPLHERHP